MGSKRGCPSPEEPGNALLSGFLRAGTPSFTYRTPVNGLLCQSYAIVMSPIVSMGVGETLYTKNSQMAKTLFGV